MANVTIQTVHLIDKVGELSRKLSMSQMEAQARSDNEDRQAATIVEQAARIAELEAAAAPKPNRAARRKADKKES